MDQEMWKQWYTRLYFYAKEFSGLSHEDREEVVSEVLVKSWRQDPAKIIASTHGAWLYRIAHNALIDRQRMVRTLNAHILQIHTPGKASKEDSGTVKSRAGFVGQASAVLDIEARQDPQNTCQPEMDFIKAEETRELRSALTQLEQVDRELLFLLFSEELSYKEAAQICAMPEGTAKSRVSRAKKTLASILSQGGAYHDQ